MEGFFACFDELEDPRAANARHDLTETLFIALLACLSGAKACSDMAEFGRSKEALLRRFLTLKHGIPSHDTFSRVFRLLDPEAFEAAFRDFMGAFAHAARIASPKGVIALDGKALRRAYERGQAHMPRVMVTAWASQTRLALASRLAPGNNEVEAALALIGLLRLEGCVVTADALHCRPDTAQAILVRGGDYALRIKDNRPALLRRVKATLDGAGVKRVRQEEVRNGHTETRHAEVAPAPVIALHEAFPGLAAVARITIAHDGQPVEPRYYLLSKVFTPARLLKIARAHWGIENQLHWPLDVILDEDGARSRKDHAPQNIAVLRRLALNVARAHPDTNTSLRRKLLRAGWDDNFLFELIRHMR